MSDVTIDVRGLAAGDKPHLSIRIDLGPNQSKEAKELLRLLFASDEPTLGDSVAAARAK